MNVKPHTDFVACVPGALNGGLVRTAYFDGMVLTEADLVRDQTYWQTKRRLTNRALGQGVVWGLKLEWDAKSRSFCLSPGYGLSCCGDDLVVECPERIPEKSLLDPCDPLCRKLLAHGKADCGCDPAPDGPVEAYVLLEYVECPEEPRPLYEDAYGKESDRCRYSAVRETTRLRLVPPPPPEPSGPIGAFCEKIEQMRQKLAAAGVPPPEPIFTGTQPDAIVSVAHHADGGEIDKVGSAGLAGPDEEATVVTGPTVSDATQVRIAIEPPPGRFLASVVTEDGAKLAAADTAFGWHVDVEARQLVPGWSRTVQVEIAPLFSTKPAVKATYRLSAQRSATGAITITAVTEARAYAPARGDCSSLLADGLFLIEDPNCLWRTLALAVICGWFTGTLAAAPCGELDEKAEVDEARALLAWWICAAAWQVLFGIEVTDANRDLIVRCLQKLFADWCDGFYYKGPRCDCPQHGIYLGCVRISKQCKIVCFDPWKHRRYVLTGPLLTHWGRLFGLAPIDVAAGRLASWICCVAHGKYERYAVAGMSAFTAEVALSKSGAGVVLGPNLDQLVAAKGVTVQSTREIGAVEMVGRILAGLLSGDDTIAPISSGRDVYSVPGLGLHLMERASTAIVPISGFGRHSALDVEVQRISASLSPLARAPAADLVAVLADGLSLDMLKAPSDDELFQPLVKAMSDSGVKTIGDLTRIGPEEAVEVARRKLSADPAFARPMAVEATVDQLFGIALSVVRGAGDALVAEAEGRTADAPFTRADLGEPGTIAALRKATQAHLKGRGLSAEAMRQIAGKAQAKRS